MSVVTRFLLSLAVLAPLALGQGPAGAGMIGSPRSAPRLSAAYDVAGGGKSLIRTPADDLLGVGPNYTTAFHPDHVVFDGPSEPNSTPPSWRFQFTSASRQESVDPSFIAEQPTTVELKAGADRVDYLRRQGTLVERYELRDDGVEQSFVFHELPTGIGDLIVRGAVTSNRSLEFQSPSELRFGSKANGIRVNKVLGIDAEGATAQGTLRCIDGILELILPAAFVDSAALPLTLDPLVGSTSSASTGFGDNRADMAYDETNDLYFVVWHSPLSSIDLIRGQRLRADGTPVGGPVTIASVNRSATSQVANVQVRDAFVIVWANGGDIFARSLQAATGSLSPQIVVRNTNDFEADPDVGGEALTVDDEALVVWQNRTLSRIEAAQVNVNAAGICSVFDFTVITPTGGGRERHPAISKSGGTTGNHLIVWEFGVIGTTAIFGAIVNRNLTYLDSSIEIEPFGPRNHENPDVDGDGSSWIVAAESDLLTPPTLDRDIACRGVFFDVGIGWTTDRMFVEAGINDDEKDPAVSWIGDSALVAFADHDGSNYDTYVKTVDLFDCRLCENEQFLDISGNNHAPAIASQHSGGSNGEQAMVVWQSIESFLSTIDARLYEAEDGLFVNLGGGCGTGEQAYAGCARADRGELRIRLEGAATSKPTFLGLSLVHAPLACGGCGLMNIGPSLSIFFAGNTGAALGRNSFRLSYPADPAFIGITLYSQWLIEGGPCFGYSLSDTLSLTLQ